MSDVTRLWRPLEAERACVWPEVWDVLVAADQEFVPPLSARRSTTQRDLAPAAGSGGEPVEYFRQVQTQELILVSVRGTGQEAGAGKVPVPGQGAAAGSVAAGAGDRHVDGLMSYVHGYRLVTEGYEGPCLYVSTVVVRPASRGRHLAERMYGELIALSQRTGLPVATRTWGTNAAHLRVLGRLGFAVVGRLVDDRGPGVDTVYLLREAR